jgi:hypothetical protein
MIDARAEPCTTPVTFACSRCARGEARLIAAAVLCAGAASIVVHGLTVEPLMKWCSGR